MPTRRYEKQARYCTLMGYLGAAAPKPVFATFCLAAKGGRARRRETPCPFGRGHRSPPQQRLAKRKARGQKQGADWNRRKPLNARLNGQDVPCPSGKTPISRGKPAKRFPQGEEAQWSERIFAARRKQAMRNLCRRGPAAARFLLEKENGGRNRPPGRNSCQKHQPSRAAGSCHAACVAARCEKESLWQKTRKKRPM